LDLLRTLAVSLVFLGHLSITGTVHHIGLEGVAHFGVLLFFVHTALVLMMSMERMSLSGPGLYRSFLVRRFFRIYPLSVLCVLVMVGLRIPSAAWRPNYQWAGWPAFISNLLLAQNLTHSPSVDIVLWSLPFEMQMYMVLPLLFLLALRFRGLRTMVWAWLAATGVAALEYAVRPDLAAVPGAPGKYSVCYYFPCFLAGVFAWRLMRTCKPRLPGWSWAVCLAGLVIAWRVGLALRGYSPGPLRAFQLVEAGNTGLDMLTEWLFCAVTGLAIPWFAQLQCGWLNWIGKRIARYSYGIYLWHMPVLWLCFARFHTGSTAVSGALAVLLTGLVAVVLYHGLEAPAINLGKRIATALASRRPVAE